MSKMTSQENDYLHCKCVKCGHELRDDCIKIPCKCCDLEDAFSVVAMVDFESL